MARRASDRSVVVAVFDGVAGAREAVQAVRSLGLREQQVGVLLPGQSVMPSRVQPPATGTLLDVAAGTGDAHDLGAALMNLGVPAGEARFYATEAEAGRALVVVDADGRAEEVRQLVLERGGYDVQSRGAALIRSGQGGVPGGVGGQPMDVTSNWADVRSRYEMLWQQHYGTTDATWEQMEPLYEYGWRLANRADDRGRPWDSVESALERDWPASPFAGSMAWSDAAGPLRDVWEDVAEEAATGAEGGADRRIARQGSDQSVAARDLQPPRQGAA